MVLSTSLNEYSKRNNFPLDSGLGSRVYTSFVIGSQLQIGKVAALAGVSIDTVRYYERRRLIACVSRSTGGFRLFTIATVERIRFIKQAQDIGLSLDEIKEFLISGGGAQQCERVRDLLKEKLNELDERIRMMSEFRSTLSRHLAACETELQQHGAAASCPVIIKIVHTKQKEKKR